MIAKLLAACAPGDTLLLSSHDANACEHTLPGFASDFLKRHHESNQGWLLQAFGFMAVPAIAVDEDFCITIWNSGAVAVFGYSAREAVGRRIFDLIVPREALPHVLDIAQRLRHGDVVAHSVNRNLTKDGRSIVCEWHNTPLLTKEGEFFGVLALVHDITERHKAETQLTDSRERLRMATSAANMGAWNWDIAKARFFLSDGMGKMFGLAAGDGPETPTELLALVHPDDRHVLLKAFSDASERGQSSTFEYRVMWPDGSIHWIETHSNVMFDESGKPSYGMGVALDITQRKQDAAAIARASRALQTLSAVNRELVHAVSEQQLLDAVCAVLVEQGGYRMAAVGYPEQDECQTLTPVAWAGTVAGYFNDATFESWGDNPNGQKPTARAIRSGKIEICHDIGSDEHFAKWRTAALERKYASNAALPLFDGARVIGALSIYSQESGAFDEGEVDLLDELAGDLSYGIATLRMRLQHEQTMKTHLRDAHRLKRNLEDSIQAIAATLEMRDPYTAGHEKRVAKLAVAIAREMNLPSDQIEGLYMAGVVHDLGKIRVPAEILCKPGRLGAIEYALICTHPQVGYDILKDIKFPWPIAQMVLQHHERIDGSGYPQGLQGDAILLEARILAVADVVEAMGSHRPYRASVGIDKALAEIESGRAIRYDGAVVDACLALFRERGYVLPSADK
ncbi:MAG: HD domain-containing phosphohydrolase [Pseudomonadota bacterium]